VESIQQRYRLRGYNGNELQNNSNFEDG
jgi:hypothetical protein